MKLWQPRDYMEVMDLENDYFLARFKNAEDFQYVFEGGPWQIMNHYLVMQRWRPEFFPFEDDMKHVAVWVRIPGLPVEYYDSKILLRIGNSIDKTMKIDGNSLMGKDGPVGELFQVRAKFSRICVEVDLRMVLVSKFELNGRIYMVEYEGLHRVCFLCGRYGHRKDGGRRQQHISGDKGKSVSNNGGMANQENKSVRSGSRFKILEQDQEEILSGQENEEISQQTNDRGEKGDDGGNQIDNLMIDSADSTPSSGEKILDKAKATRDSEVSEPRTIIEGPIGGGGKGKDRQKGNIGCQLETEGISHAHARRPPDGPNVEGAANRLAHIDNGDSNLLGNQGISLLKGTEGLKDYGLDGVDLQTQAQ
ncbi:hypothetical protein SESBI_49098 [Sesbania bispinosa]|nr:hypothetical protein SESBI_49098 [Sesbania bispinosa]